MSMDNEVCKLKPIINLPCIPHYNRCGNTFPVLKVRAGKTRATVTVLTRESGNYEPVQSTKSCYLDSAKSGEGIQSPESQQSRFATFQPCTPPKERYSGRRITVICMF